MLNSASFSKSSKKLQCPDIYCHLFMQIDRMDLAPRVATLRIYPIVEVAPPFISVEDDMNASKTGILRDFMSR